MAQQRLKIIVAHLDSLLFFHGLMMNKKETSYVERFRTLGEAFKTKHEWFMEKWPLLRSSDLARREMLAALPASDPKVLRYCLQKTLGVRDSDRESDSLFADATYLCWVLASTEITLAGRLALRVIRSRLWIESALSEAAEVLTQPESDHVVGQFWVVALNRLAALHSVKFASVRASEGQVLSMSAIACNLVAEMMAREHQLDAEWLTVTEAARELMKYMPDLSIQKARARVSNAANHNHFNATGERQSRRIEPKTFKGWLNDQRDLDLDRDNDAP